MGSFSEVVLSFDFRADTPDEVMAAFAELAEPGAAPPEAPALPAPVVEAWEHWEPDWRDEYDVGTAPPDDAPWRHAWAPWLRSAMGVQTTPHARLTWAEMGRWNLDVRSSFKCGPETVSEFLAWLAPYVETYGDDSAPKLVGYVHFEYAPRPHLFWVRERRWELEDLNPNDDWAW